MVPVNVSITSIYVYNCVERDMCEVSWLSSRKIFRRAGEDKWPFFKIYVIVSIVLSLVSFFFKFKGGNNDLGGEKVV